jgi:CspA family cold shock protein
MAAGTVKWFNDAKGFGFFQQDNGAQTSSATTFCHHTAINMQGFRTLQEGQKVEFDVKLGPKGHQAENVRAMGT